MLLRLAVLVTVSGCSIALTKAPAEPLVAPPDCTTSKGTVYLDGIGAGAAMGTSLFLGLVAIAKEGSTPDGERNDYAYATLFTFLGGVMLATSGVIGGMRVRSCRKAHETWQVMTPPPPRAVPPAGTERGFCRLAPEPPCDPGLSCLSNRCVVF